MLMGFAESDSETQAYVAAFREGLQKLGWTEGRNIGWTEGRNIRIDTRWAAADVELMQRFAKELVALQPDLILSHTTPTTTALLQQTRTIPIVFATVSDPIGSGVVGFVHLFSPDKVPRSWVAAFPQGLKEAGFTEGQNVAVEYHWAQGEADRYSALVADLARRQVAVIAATGGEPCPN